MKIVNPVGRDPGKEENLKAHRACVCWVNPNGNTAQSTVYAYDSCFRCACDCQPGNPLNNSANSNLALAHNY